jgi:tetratricopeptide (TPR) repeat protein
MHEDARNLVCLEEFEKAEAKFCEALNGHQYLLSSVHESTSALAYDLANFYARRDRMHDAYAVLDWLIKEHLNNSYVGDKETAAHISRVIQLLHSWSRSEEAINLLTRTLVSCHKLAGSQDLAPSLNQMSPETENPSKEPEISEIPNFIPANPAAHFGDELSQLKCELKIAKSYSKAGKKEAESLLLRLINKCEQNPDRFFAQHFEGACSLVGLYQKQGDLYKLFAALKSAGDIFWNIIEGQSGGPSTLKTAIKLVHLYIQAELAPTARPMLERIEREVARIHDEEDEEFVDLLVTLGIYYQDHNSWTDAERHFEHALAIAMREHELDCKVVSTLEAALETKCFTLQLPTLEGSRAKFRSTGFKRCGCSGYADEIDGRYRRRK